MNAPNRFDFYTHWARAQFEHYGPCVAAVETFTANGDRRIGAAFHVGEGVYVTARHVVQDKIISVFNANVGQGLIVSGPHFHPDPSVDIACFRVEEVWPDYIPLGGHLDDWMGRDEFMLHRTLVMGYPPIPFSAEPVLVASLGEINATIDKYIGKHPHFILSTMARGGFSGAPVLFAYNQERADETTAALGIVTESLITNGKDPELGYLAVLSVEPIYTCLDHNDMLPKGQSLER